ncbi:MAG: sigma-70 family RNA polymerase sigma factor, partial [Planctomycetota bacterium]
DKRDAGREVEREDGVPNAHELAVIYGTSLGPEGNAIRAETIELIEAAVDRLPEDTRTIVSLRIAGNLSHREVAEHMGRSEAAVRQAFGRAVAQLSVRLGPLLGERE